MKNLLDNLTDTGYIHRPLLFIMLTFLMFACSGQDSTDEQDVREPIHYLALGDSYTIGQGVPIRENWPNQLVDSLLSGNCIVDTSFIIARTGWTTTDLLDAMAEEDLSSFNLVSLLIGVNNQFQRKPFELYEEEFNELLGKAIEIAGHERVFVVSIPDYGVTPFGSNNAGVIAEELDAYNAYAREQCEVRSIPFINITEISRSLGSSEGALAPDNLHPSQEQYTLWLEEIIPLVETLVK